jgi:hypothetical protein
MIKIVYKLKSWFGIKEEKRRREPKLIKNEFFARQAREQFERLSRKGLSIPIVTL